MSFPAGASVITLTGTFPVPVGGTARAGRVVLTPSATLVDATQKAIYSGGGTVPLDNAGKFSVVLLCDNDTDVQPTGWRWRVDEQPAGGPRRTYWIALPSTLGPTVDLSTLASVDEPDGGSGGSLTATPVGPAGGALTGTYPNPQLSSATIASFDPAGAANAAQTAAATDATTKANAAQAAATGAAAADATAKVAAHTAASDPHGDRAAASAALAAHEADTTSVHGIPNTADLETGTGAQSKADAAQAAATSAAATDATSKVTAHTNAADPHGDRAWAAGQFATITVVNTLTGTVTTLQGTVSAIDGYLNDALNRVAAIENGTAFLAGGHFTAAVEITDDLTVTGYTTLAGGQFNGDFAAFGDMVLYGTNKGFRFRRGGDATDFEGAGTDLVISVWSGGDFTGTQRSYLRLSSDAQNAQLAGPLEIVSALYGGAVHKLDPDTGVAAVGAKNSLANIRLCGRLAVAGAPTTGTWTAGDAVQDSAGAWWLCTADGSPGTWAGGAGGSTIRSATARIVDGAVVDLPSAASWVIAETSVGTKLQCSIAAAAGDRVRVEADFMRSGAHFLDWVLLDSAGAPAVYGTTRTSTPASEGAPSMYPSTSFPGTQGAKQFVVSAGHISSGQITIALAHQGTAAGRVYANSTYPFEMLLTNLGPEPA